MIKQVLKFPGGNKCRSRLQYQLDAEAVPVSVLAVAPVTSAYYFISFAFAYFVWSRKVLKSRWIYLPRAAFISA
ncbi:MULTISPECIES: hypothetical protein [Methylobacter]